MAKVIRARHVQTMCNIKPKTLSQILGPGSGFSVLRFDPGLGPYILEFESQVLGPWFRVPGSRSHILGFSLFINYRV